MKKMLKNGLKITAAVIMISTVAQGAESKAAENAGKVVKGTAAGVSGTVGGTVGAAEGAAEGTSPEPRKE